MGILTFCMVDTMDWDAVSTAVTTATATTTARGRLRLPPRLRLTPTFCMVDMVLLATATVLATGDTTGDKLPTPLQDLNHRRKTLTLRRLVLQIFRWALLGAALSRGTNTYVAKPSFQ